MPEESKPANQNHLIIRPSTGVVSVPDGGTSAMSEIIRRSLAHIQTSRTLDRLYRIGEHELYKPDYGLVCTWADELGISPENVLDLLLMSTVDVGDWDDGLREAPPDTELVNGRFFNLTFPPENLSYSPRADSLSFPPSGGLMIERLHWRSLSPIEIPLLPNLAQLFCGDRQLTQLELSAVPNLTKLSCEGNQLANLELINVPHLIELDCWGNQLTQLELSAVPNLTQLYCGGNQLAVLDIRPLVNLKQLKLYDNHSTRIIQRPDQNFK